MSARRANPLRGYLVDVGEVLDLMHDRMDHHNRQRQQVAVGSRHYDEQIGAHAALSELHRLVLEIDIEKRKR